MGSVSGVAWVASCVGSVLAWAVCLRGGCASMGGMGVVWRGYYASMGGVPA